MKNRLFLILILLILAISLINCDITPNPYDKYSYYDDFEEGGFKNSEYWSNINSNASPDNPPIFSDIEDGIVFEEGSGYNGDYALKLDGTKLTPLNFERIQLSIELLVSGSEDSYVEFWYKVNADSTDVLGSKSVFRLIDAEAEDPTESIMEKTGEVEWTQYKHTLTPGRHELVWVFLLVVSNEIDSAWIDDIGFGDNINILEVQQRPSVFREKLIVNPSDPSESTELVLIEDDDEEDAEAEDIINVKTNGQTIDYYIYNDGKLDLEIEDIDMSNDSGYFSVIEPTSFPITLTPYDKVKLSININSSSTETGILETININSDAYSSLNVYRIDIEVDIVSPPASLSGLNATNGRYVSLNWNDGPTDTHHYELWRAFDDGSGTSPDEDTYIQITDTNLVNEPVLIMDSEFADNRGLPSQDYWYKVRYMNNDGVLSEFSNDVAGNNTLVANSLTLDPDPWQQGNLDSFGFEDVPTCEWWHIDTLTVGNEYHLYWRDDYDGGPQDGTMADIQLEVFKSDGNDEYELLDWDFGYPNGNGTPETGGDGETITVEETEIWIRVRPYSNIHFSTGPYEIYFGENTQSGS